MARLDFHRVLQRFIERGIGRRRWRPSVLAGSTPPPARLPATHGAAAQALVDPLAFGSVAFRGRDAPDYHLHMHLVIPKGKLPCVLLPTVFPMIRKFRVVLAGNAVKTV